MPWYIVTLLIILISFYILVVVVAALDTEQLQEYRNEQKEAFKREIIEQAKLEMRNEKGC